MAGVKQWLLARIVEQSTWTGIGAIIASMAFIPHAAEIGALAPTLGVMIVSVIKIILPDPGVAK